MTATATITVTNTDLVALAHKLQDICHEDNTTWLEGTIIERATNILEHQPLYLADQDATYYLLPSGRIAVRHNTTATHLCDICGKSTENSRLWYKSTPMCLPCAAVVVPL